MLCVNMQTSFLHPPFGFALFYLRGVAPKEVKSSDIYWGAMPWIGLQAIMVAVVIAFPITVTGLLDAPRKVDLDKIKIEIRILSCHCRSISASRRIEKISLPGIDPGEILGGLPAACEGMPFARGTAGPMGTLRLTNRLVEWWLSGDDPLRREDGCAQVAVR